MESKVSPTLADQVVDHADDDQVYVVVELRPGTAAATGTRAQKIARLKREFDEEAAPVKQAIEDLGGEVLEGAWLNKTLRTRLPKWALEQLEKDDRVALLDATRSIRAEDLARAGPTPRPEPPEPNR